MTEKEPEHCGSAHCKIKHKWVDVGTPYERLYPMNCGAVRWRNTEELEKADKKLKATIKEFIEKLYTEEELANAPQPKEGNVNDQFMKGPKQ